MSTADRAIKPAAPSLASALWSRYLISLAEHPLGTKMGTAATLNFLQEVVATAATKGDTTAGAKKATLMAAYGALIGGPLGHYLYGFMERLFKGRTGPGVAIGKLIFGNFVVAPIQTAVYLAAMSTIAGASLADTLKTIRLRILPLLKITWLVFPSVQIIAIKYIEPAMWVPFFNAVSFAFGTYTNITTKLAVQRRAGGKAL
ncbi:hypothetical protein HDU88_006110 [Geranomyces variabilis]|nr:hypothetical protein HDU88_006110 [Geranomyces variabilis]